MGRPLGDREFRDFAAWPRKMPLETVPQVRGVLRPPCFALSSDFLYASFTFMLVILSTTTNAPLAT